MKICIVDYGMGNISSVNNALVHLGYNVKLVSNSWELKDYDVIILPGVGAFSKAMQNLKEQGLDRAIKEAAVRKKKIIGICLGMQLLLSKSYEFGETEGLGLVSGEVLSFDKVTQMKIPHMGWNYCKSKNHDFQLLNGDYYFVHSFYCKLNNKRDYLFTTTYEIDFCSALKVDDHIFGFQFHPEKSQKLGLQLLAKSIEYVEN